MKCTKLRHRQCSMIVVVVLLASALQPEVHLSATPRGADEAVRGTGKSGNAVTRLVTGDPAQINAVIAGTPRTARLMVNPVPAKVGAYPALADGGPNIVGNELRLDVGGVRMWIEVQIADWDPNQDGSPAAHFFQVKMSGGGLFGNNYGDQDDIRVAAVPCNSDATCAVAFGEAHASCHPTLGRCRPDYVDLTGTARTDGWCHPAGCAGGGGVGDPYNLQWFAFYAMPDGVPQIRPDDGSIRYGGTCVLDIPPGAKGKYVVNLNTDESFIGDTARNLIPLLSESGFVVNISDTGQCCYGLGTLDEGCVDDIHRAECGDDEPGPFVFTPGGHCPPQGLDCSSYFGACCDTISGECLDAVLEADCQGTHRVWTSGTSCDDAACIADTGACCDHDPFGPCTDDTVLTDCLCATCTWHKIQACAEIECAPTPIPTVSEWGLAILTLLLLTAAKIYFGRRASEPRFVTPHRD